MAKDIDLNCDMGESYGRWTLGADEEIMPWITSANVACGFHGGDPHVMRRTVALALKHTVAIGSHPSLPDLMGFGRRVMDVTPQEVKDYLCYQTGALGEVRTLDGVEIDISVQTICCHGDTPGAQRSCGWSGKRSTRPGAAFGRCASGSRRPDRAARPVSLAEDRLAPWTSRGA